MNKLWLLFPCLDMFYISLQTHAKTSAFNDDAEKKRQKNIDPPKPSHKAMLRLTSFSPIISLSLLGILLLLSACSLNEINSQLKIVDSAKEITGNIKISYPTSGSVVVLLFENKGEDSVTLVDQFTLTGKGKYTFYTTPGNFLIAAYIDSNDDGTYQESEHSTFSGIEDGKPLFFTIGNVKRYQAGTLIFKENVRAGGAYKGSIDLGKMNENIGKKVSINDPMFSEEYASMSLWRPLDFIADIGGGLFILDEYQEGKIPVLFIHGVKGSPNNWVNVIKNIDDNRFQPFVLHYASGARLDMISNYLVKAINNLYGKYHFKEFYVVAHSMGGLVARSFIMKHYQSQHPSKIKLFITINSPMLGLDIANAGLKFSPVLVPSWRDVASNSRFIQTINEWQWPDNIPYHLIFSYVSGKGDDGVVPLESQIPPKLQSESRRIYGFNASHAGLLKQKKCTSLLNNVLNKSFDCKGLKSE